MHYGWRVLFGGGAAARRRFERFAQTMSMTDGDSEPRTMSAGEGAADVLLQRTQHGLHAVFVRILFIDLGGQDTGFRLRDAERNARFQPPHDGDGVAPAVGFGRERKRHNRSMWVPGAKMDPKSKDCGITPTTVTAALSRVMGRPTMLGSAASGAARDHN